MPTNPGQIYKLIPEVMKAVGAIGKNQHASGGGTFQYRGVDDVYDALQPALIDAGVCIIPRVLEQAVVDSKTTQGKWTQLATVRMAWDLWAPDGSHIEAITAGAATDGQGRALAQAQSDAFKQCIFKAFCVPVQGEHDAEANLEPMAGPDGDANSRQAGPQAGDTQPDTF